MTQKEYTALRRIVAAGVLKIYPKPDTDLDDLISDVILYLLEKGYEPTPLHIRWGTLNTLKKWRRHKEKKVRFYDHNLTQNTSPKQPDNIVELRQFWERCFSLLKSHKQKEALQFYCEGENLESLGERGVLFERKRYAIQKIRRQL